MRILFKTVATVLALIGCLEAQTGSQAVYFLSVSLGMEYRGVRLYRVDTGQGPAVQLVREVTEDWKTVLADYDLRKIAVVPMSGTNIAVVDMAAPFAPYTLSADYCGLDDSKCPAEESRIPEGFYFLVEKEALLVATPLRRVWKPGQPQEPAPSLVAVRIGDSHAEPENLPMTEVAHLRMSGCVGGALRGTINHMPEVRGNPLRILLSRDVGFSIGIPAPPYIQPKPDGIGNGYWLAARTDSIAVLRPLQPLESNVIDVFDQAAGIWRRFNLPFTTVRIRAFGSWIAAIASQPRLPENLRGKKTTYTTEELRRMPDSPGKEKRMTEDLGNGPDEVIQSGTHSGVKWRVTKTRKPGYHPPRDSVDELFQTSDEYFPGDLLVINGRTGQQFTIHTGQGDSEVVLVTDQAVFYRINDEIYRADLTDGKLAGAVKIAEGPVIVGAHWAFLGPSPSAL